jgi:hypothetical protein
MTRRNLFLTLMVSISGTFLWAQQPTWTPKLTMPKEAWLPGEPISATLSLTNEKGSAQPFEWHGQFYLDGAENPCVDRFVVVAGNPIPDAGSSGSKTQVPPVLESPGSSHQIEFAISRCCNLLARAPQTIGRHRLCYRDKSIRGKEREVCIEFLVLPPKGADEAVFNAFPSTLRDIICDASSLKIDLVSSCPSSTYAGYALLPAGQCIPDPRVFLVNFLEHDKTAERWPQTAGQMASEKKKDLEDDEKRVAQLSAYLKVHPDFARADALKVELAGRLAMLGRFDEAHALCDEITLKDAGSLESQKANMLMDFLLEKGFRGEKKAVASPEPRQAAKPPNEKKP